MNTSSWVRPKHALVSVRSVSVAPLTKTERLTKRRGERVEIRALRAEARRAGSVVEDPVPASVCSNCLVEIDLEGDCACQAVV